MVTTGIDGEEVHDGSEWDGRLATRSTSKPIAPPEKRGHHAPDRASLGHCFSRYSEGA